MLLCLDVQYGSEATVTAAVGFEEWSASESCLELVISKPAKPAPYVPGEFFKREMPHLLEVVARVRTSRQLEAVIVDGHAWLRPGQLGLGAKLHQELCGEVAVVGVAKSRFRDGVALAVVRGQSAQPLHVSAVGMSAEVAAQRVKGMHGPHRIPTMLKRVDQLARGLQSADSAKHL